MPEDKIFKIRHSLSHIMAMAVLKKFPEAKLAIGPVIDNGFYYDFLLPDKLSEDHLPSLEKTMREIIKQKIDFKKKIVPRDKALELVKQKGEDFKVELINDLPDEDKISFYTSGEFTDLCKGPHVKNSSEINPEAFKLVCLAGAYWRGDSKREMLTRIYGVAFKTKTELDKHLEMIAQAKKRDHRKLGQELDLFIIDEEVGQGLILWQPKGAMIYELIRDFALNTYLEQGYQPVITPHIASSKLWQHSGHLDFYQESMYNAFGIEDEEYLLKPMNCPFHATIYNSRKRSYRELPLRWTEMGTVYRYERSGVLHGLTRVRGFTQDDAHIICTPEQLEVEVKRAFELTMFILNTFGFKKADMEINLSVRDPENKDKFIGSDENWAKAEKTLQKILEEAGCKKIIYDVGGAVFYGPKIDIKVADAIGRQWQLSTIQFDFNLPSRFTMTYQGADGQEHTPFMIHRALLGSLERFIGVLIEHYAGNFPTWLAPIQLKILTVSETHGEFANQLKTAFNKHGLRVEIDDSSETVGNKIRKTAKEKVPYTLVIGDKEMNSAKLSVRVRGNEELLAIDQSEFIRKIKQEVKKRKLKLMT